MIFITAKHEEEDKLAGFTSGADDYLSKPFSHKELMARVEAVIRRTYPEKFSKTLDYRDVSIDLKSHKVFRNKAEIKLSPKEFDQAMLDLTNFLAYMTDPMKVERESIGTYVLLYLFIFTMLSYLLYREFKKDLH